MAVSGMDAAVLNTSKAEPLKGNIRHSVSKWCFGSYPLEEFCEICKEIGIESIELLDPKDWPVVQKHGLTVADRRHVPGSRIGNRSWFQRPESA